MPWATIIRDIETGKVTLVLADPQPVDVNRYERHGVPCYESGDEILFGVHDFTRNCICRPKIAEDEHGDEIIVHQERKPN